MRSPLSLGVLGVVWRAEHAERAWPDRPPGCTPGGAMVPLVDVRPGSGRGLQLTFQPQGWSPGHGVIVEP
ncbi:hypothetical protein AB0F17_59800 [Nonomuraea sp. NPDC026600]|uniref:hypothetical protein n=1 Tax=Nonomuraea sp. NPDC026600 TaxID=3155363 RepID=UPI0033ED47CA